MPIRVFLIDDHVLVRTGMRLLLAGETDSELSIKLPSLHCRTVS